MVTLWDFVHAVKSYNHQLEENKYYQRKVVKCQKFAVETWSTLTNMLDNFSNILASQIMYELLGPGAAERWLYWRSRTREQVSLSFNCWKKKNAVFVSVYFKFLLRNIFCQLYSLVSIEKFHDNLIQQHGVLNVT